MYATNGLADLLGIPASELCGKSFYYCIQENCLREGVKCLESAKANDSIAYLRFWFRDPRQDDRMDQDERMSDGHSSGDEDDGGVHLPELMEHEGSENAVYSDSSHSMRSSVERDQNKNSTLDPNSRSSSGNSTDMGGNSNDGIFDRPEGNQQSRSSSISAPDETPFDGGPWSIEPNPPQIELEAVVSCTSDGLVVILRHAKPFIPQMAQISSGESQSPYANGYFASPWATNPILPDANDSVYESLPHLRQPPYAPQHPTAARASLAANAGPSGEEFMNCIREVAVFAWSLCGINGSLERHARGTPNGESQPPGGLPVWDPNANAGPEIERPLRGDYLGDGYGPPQSRQRQIGYHDNDNNSYQNQQNNSYGNDYGNDIKPMNGTGTEYSSDFRLSSAAAGYRSPDDERAWSPTYHSTNGTDGRVSHGFG